MSLLFLLSECPILPSSIAHGFVSGSRSLEGDRYRSFCEPGYLLIDTLVSGMALFLLVSSVKNLSLSLRRKRTSLERGRIYNVNGGSVAEWLGRWT